jgi:hypothetical protein
LHVIDSKNKLLEYFECDSVVCCTEYVGCNITTNGKSVMSTEPVLVQSLVNEFEMVNKNYMTPAPAGKFLEYTENTEGIIQFEMIKYQAGVGKLLYLSCWSRTEISNIVRKLASLFAPCPESTCESYGKGNGLLLGYKK